MNGKKGREFQPAIDFKLIHFIRFIVNSLTGQLNILRVTKDDYGNYTCKATNAAGEDTERVLLNVIIRPRIYELLNVTQPVKEEAELLCKASGRPPPEITFRFVKRFVFYV